MIYVRRHLAHPLGVQKVIKGDIRNRVDLTTGGIVGEGDGKVLYDTQANKGVCWFILDYESGGRIVHRED